MTAWANMQYKSLCQNMQAQEQSYGCCETSYLWACPIWSWLTSQLSCFITVSPPFPASFFSLQKVGARSSVCSEEAPWPTRLSLTFSLINKTTNWSFLILGTLVIKSLLRWNETLNFMSRHHEHISRRGRETGSISAIKYTTLFRSLTLSAAILHFIFETCRTSLSVQYLCIFLNIRERRKSCIQLFFPPHSFPLSWLSPLNVAVNRDDWLRVPVQHPTGHGMHLHCMEQGIHGEKRDNLSLWGEGLKGGQIKKRKNKQKHQTEVFNPNFEALLLLFLLSDILPRSLPKLNQAARVDVGEHNPVCSSH